MGEFLSLVVIGALALVSPFLVRRVRLPTVAAETILGLVVGFGAYLYLQSTGTPLFELGDAVKFLGRIGLVYLLFLMGLEMDFDILAARGPAGVGRSLVYYVWCVLLAALAVTLLQLPIVVVIILGAISIAIPLSALREEHRLHTPFGSDVLSTALVTDVITMTLLALVIGGSASLSILGNDIPRIWLVGIVPLLFGGVYAAYRLTILVLWHRPRFFVNLLKGSDTVELGVRASFTLLFIFVALAEFAGAEAILGAFLAGALMSGLTRKGAALEKKLAGAGYGFFIPIFFISVGLNFKFDAVKDLSMLLILPVLIAVAFAVKTIPAVLFIRRHGSRGTLRMGVLLSAELSLGIAGTLLAREAEPPLLNDGQTAVLLLTILAMAILAPAGYRALEPRPPGKPSPTPERAVKPAPAGAGGGR